MKADWRDTQILHGVSEKDFYRYAGEDCAGQYLGGDLVCEPASYGHENRAFFLCALLRLYFEERGGGVAVGSRYPMRLDEKWSPEPDVLAVRDDRRHLLTPRRLEGPADLVIEITSHSTSWVDVGRKLPRYREARVPEIWLIDPFARSIRTETWSAEAEGYCIRRMTTGRLGSAVFPGLWIEASWLWREPLPPVLGCLRQVLAPPR